MLKHVDRLTCYGKSFFVILKYLQHCCRVPKKRSSARISLDDSQKLAILRWIYPHRKILFGKFDNGAGVTNKAKCKIWTDIHERAVAAGFPVSDVEHTRRVRIEGF
jgi:hypothetical protein